jgi:hypothetical protein
MGQFIIVLNLTVFFGNVSENAEIPRLSESSIARFGF